MNSGRLSSRGGAEPAFRVGVAELIKMDKKRMESLMDQVIARLEKMADEEAMKGDQR